MSDMRPTTHWDCVEAGAICHEQCAIAEIKRLRAERDALSQTSFELCGQCGWRTSIPGEGCIKCERDALLNTIRLAASLLNSDRGAGIAVICLLNQAAIDAARKSE